MANEYSTIYSKIFPVSILLGAIGMYNYGPELIEYLNNATSGSCQGLVNFINSPGKTIASRVILSGLGALALGYPIHHMVGYLDNKREERRKRAHNEELEQLRGQIIVGNLKNR